MEKKYFATLMVVAFFGMQCAFAAESIKITISDTMNQVIFDGKWSGGREWKHSSENILQYKDGTIVYLRSAHQSNFIYVFIDALSLGDFNKHGDMATICFDKHDNRPLIPNSDDYCFITTLGGNNPITLQGNSSLAFTSNFNKIPNPENLIAVGGVSDNADRYSSDPHSGYEFRIPTDTIGRSDIYGFYVGIYNEHSKRIYSWPTDIVSNSTLIIPSPSRWGELISPDKSLPEFPWPLISLLAAMIPIVYFTRRQIP